MNIFVIAGQSNASGRGTNNQSYHHATLTASVFANDYTVKNLADPVDSASGQIDTVSVDSPGGSIWPLLATKILAQTGESVMFVPCALGGSSITAWQPGANHQDRTTLYGSMVYRALQAASVSGGTLRGVLWWQGETDASDGMSQATYNGYLDTIANAVATDLGIPLMPCKLQNSVGITDANELAINAAIGEAWADNANVLTGPDLRDIASDDAYHLQTDDKLNSAADRWWSAMNREFSLGAAMAASDARPIPRKGEAYRLYFTIFDADGDLVSGATGLDSEYAIDGVFQGDCTNEATEIGSMGLYYIDLTASEMNGDGIQGITKTSTSGAKTTPWFLYPEELGDIRVNVTQISSDTTAADNAEAFFDGTGYAGTNNVIPTVTTVNGLANNVITAAAIATDAVTELQTGLATASALSTLSTSVATLTGYVDTEVAAIKAVTDNLPNSGALTTITNNVASILADTGTDGVVVDSGSKTGYSLATDQSGVTVGTVNALGTTAKADVNAEVVDALNVDTYAEPSSVPAATSSLAVKIRWLFALARNKMTQTSTTQALRNDADSANIATSTVSDDGSVMTRGEWS